MTLIDICLVVLLAAVLIIVDLLVFVKIFVPMWFAAKLQMYRIMAESTGKAFEQISARKKEENK